MAGQGKALAIVGGVLVVAIGAVMWLVFSSTDDAAPGPSDVRGASVADTTTEKTPKAAAVARPKKVGTATVFGEIRRTAGRMPVAGQEVLLTPERGDPWTATTDAAGAFRFEKIPHGGPYELSAAANGCGTIRIPGLAFDRNEQRDVGTLFLDPSVKLTVRVRTQDDRPVEGAVVEAFALQQSTGWDWSKAIAQMGQAPVAVAKLVTNGAGEAVFPEMTVGRWTFTARKDGFATSGQKGVSLSAGAEPKPVTIWLAPGHSLDGRVLAADKSPVAGALVMTGSSNSSWDITAAPLRLRTTTDAEGRYAFATLEQGETMIWVARVGGALEPVVSVRIPLVAHFDVVLKGTGTLTGTVTEEPGAKPVEGASVIAMSWEQIGARVATATTDADGKYSLTMTAGNVNRLTVDKAGLVQVRDPKATQYNQVVVALHDAETVTKDVTLRQGARVTGKVTGPSGPVSGANVTLYYGRPNEGYQQKTATSGADGGFEFAGIEKGTVLVLASKEGLYVPDAPDNWWEAMQSPAAVPDLKAEVPESGEVKKDVTMKAGSPVEGVVLGPDGAPLEGARVSGPAAIEGAPTAKDGAFRVLGVRPGLAVSLYCTKEGLAQATSKPFPVIADQPTTGITLRMLTGPHVRGTVTSLSGAPLVEAMVLIAFKGSGQNSPWEEQSRWQNALRAPVRADGTYDAALTYRPPGQIIVRATSLAQATTETKPADLAEGSEVYTFDLALPDGVDLVGKVVSKAGGAAVAGAQVSLTPHKTAADYGGVQYGWNAPTTVWAVSDADGAFRVPHLAPGSYELVVNAAGFVTWTSTSDVAADKPVTATMSPELTIDGVVVYADGGPVQGVAVVANEPGGNRNVNYGGMSPGGRNAITDAKGAFHIGGVAEGTYALDVSAPWGTTVNVRAKHVDGVAAGSKDVKITVEAGAVISGRVVDSQKRPIPTAWISANPVVKPGTPQTGSDWRNAQTLADGTFTLTGLSDQPYHLNVGFSGNGQSYKPAQMDNVAPGTKDLEIVLADGFSISGTLTDPDGHPLFQIAIQATPETPSAESQASNSWTDQSGKFTISGIGPGNYKLDIAPWGGNSSGLSLDSKESYPAGTKDIKLVASKGVTISGVVVDEAGAGIATAFINTGKRNSWGQSHADGAFEVGGLEAGATCTLQVQAQGYVNTTVENVAAGAKDVRIVLAKGLEASGTLYGADGKPAATTHIQFQHTDGTHQQYVQTDAAGRFTATGLVDGSYTAKVYVQKAEGKNGDWKEAGSLKAGDRNVELRLQ